MAALWNKPSAFGTTIAMSSEHGLPDFSSAAPVYWYDTAYTLAQANRLKGVDVSDTEKDDALDIMNVYRRWLFHSLLIRWRRLLAITQGPVSTAYMAYGYYEAGGVTGSAQPNYTDKLECAASGSGTTVLITWTDAGWSPVSYLSPGLTYVTDNGSSAWGMTQLVDVTYLGESGGTHTAQLELLSPLNAGRENKLWLYRENYPREIPLFHLLRTDRDICAHCVEVEHNALKSYKTAYGGTGIDGQHYCTFLDWPGALISGFTSECKQTSCPYYQRPRARYMEPGKNFFTEFFLNPGRRLRQLTFAAYSTPATYAVEQCGYEGLFAMLGFPIFRDTNGLYLLSSDIMANTLLCDTGYTYGVETPRKMGFRVYGDFATVEEYNTAKGVLESDDIGMFADITPAQIQGDQTGGALVTTATRTPGADLERRLTRSIGYTQIDPGDGLDAGEHRTYGYGFSGAQRPYAREYTSRAIVGPITTGASGVNLDEETRITIVPETATIGWIDPAAPLVTSTFDGRVVFQFPRFGDSVTNALAEKLKNVGTHVVKKGTLNATGNLLYLEFALGSWIGYRAGEPQTAPDEIPYVAGANVVCPPLSWESRNPGSGAILGGRQGRLFPGDAIEFSGDDSLAGIRGTVVAAEAYGGAWDDDASMPEGIPFLPAALLANYGYRDKCTIALEGVSGRALQAAQQAGLFDSGDITISKVGLLSVVPPNIDHNGNGRAYPITVSLITDNVAPLAPLTEGIDYVLDRATGNVYLAESVFSASGSHKVHVDGQFFCSQPMLPLEEAEALDSIIDDVEANAYLPVDMTYGTQAIALSMVRDSDSNVTDHWEWSLVGTSAQDTGWDIAPGGLPNPFPLMVTQDPSTAQWRKTTLTPGSSARLGHHYTNTSGSANAWVMNYWNQAHALTFYPPRNLRAADIKSAYINLDFEGATVYKTTYTWDNTTSTDTGSTSEQDSLNLRMLCCIVSTDSVDTDLITSIVAVAIDAPANLSRVDVPDDPYDPESATVSHLRGTVDITEVLKYICGHQHELSASEQFYILLNGNEDMTGGDTDPWSLVESWVGAWDMTVSETPPTDEHGGVAGSIDGNWIEYSDLTVSAPIMQLEPGALAAGPVPHIDHDGLALIQIGG